MSHNKKSPTPSRIIGNYAGMPVYIRSFPDHVELSFKGENKSFPTRDAALFYFIDICRYHLRHFDAP